jgi:competence protein ComGC
MGPKVKIAMKSQLQAVKKIKEDSGFTLIELLITIGLIFLIVSAVSSTFIMSASTSRDVIDIITSAKDSRLIIYRVSRDIRETVEISEAESDSVTFISYMYADDAYEVINYYLHTGCQLRLVQTVEKHLRLPTSLFPSTIMNMNL